MPGEETLENEKKRDQKMRRREIKGRTANVQFQQTKNDMVELYRKGKSI
jgi:hypothetical protein